MPDEKVRTTINIKRENRDWAQENIRNLSAFIDTQIEAARRLRDKNAMQ